MGDELATANVNRAYSLGATSIAIFTFMLIFLYPRFASGEIHAMTRERHARAAWLGRV
ncbi:MAG TPA: hypothetical protein VFS53_01770 [Gemmatimonadota bacterium]|nr:hypothetical protein [Gemmatimonadota bacterium]